MLAKESSHYPMRGHIDLFGQKDCACGVKDRVVRPGERIFEEVVAEKETGWLKRFFGSMKFLLNFFNGETGRHTETPSCSTALKNCDPNSRSAS